MAETYVCAKCKKEIKRSESSISTVKNLKTLYYHARCFGASHLEDDAEKGSTATSSNSQKS